MSFIRKARYKHANNVMGSVKARYQSWPMGPRTWLVHRDIGDAGWKHASPLIERKQTCVETDASHFVESEEMQVHGTHLWCWFYSNGLFFMPITKAPCGPREIAISRDQWLVVVTVVVWCPLWFLDVPRCTWNRHASFRQDRGDAGTQKASPILSYCNGLCFRACYQSSLWAQRNNHFTWPVASCGNSHCLMPVTNVLSETSICPLPFLAHL
jgi:hypothetical protein